MAAEYIRAGSDENVAIDASEKGLYLNASMTRHAQNKLQRQRRSPVKLERKLNLKHQKNLAKELNIFTIQRLFLLDFLALVSGKNSIQTIRPDAVEILPGIMPKIIEEIRIETRIPIIAGGLIRDKSDVIDSLNAGAIGISTSNKEVWYM